MHLIPPPSRPNLTKVALTGIAALLMGSSGCATDGTGTAPTGTDKTPLTTEDQPGPYSIDASADLASVAVGSLLTVDIFAIDVDTGASIAFVADAGAGSCVDIVGTTDTAMTVTALAADCEQDIVLTAEDQTKTIVIRGYDPSYLDIEPGGAVGLQISYTTEFAWRWNDAGTGGNTDVTFWHPVAPSGWYAVGSHIEPGYRDIHAAGDVPALVIRDLSGAQDKLAAPTGYTNIWSDAGSGGNYDGSVWHPICPDGFVALGSVVQAGGGAPSLDDVRCVAEAYTTDGTVDGARLVYTDAGTGADRSVAMFRVGASALGASPDGRAAMEARAMVACGGGGCDTAAFQLLLVPLEVVESGNDDRQVRLSGPTPLQVTGRRFAARVRIPFTLIPSENPTCGDAMCATAAQRVANNVENSPFYYLERVETYAEIATLDNRQGTSAAPLTQAYTNFFEETQASEFSREVGIEVEISGNATFLGAGTEYGVTMNTALSWTNSNASTYGQSTTTTFGPFQVEAGDYGSLIQVQTEFWGRSEEGRSSAAFINAGQNSVAYLRWPLN